ncbi:MAG: iron ABC transporter [Marinilabiliales bacterium]|nr:MAG: iron ABC transporter [Marinilabiliales bacterium]
MSLNNKTFSYLFFLSLGVIVLFLLNLWYGSVLISAENVLKTLLGNTNNNSDSIIIINYRLPQAITALAIGMALGLSGLLLQTLFNNPLAGPSVLGISSGASFGVALVVLSGSITGINYLMPGLVFGNILIVASALIGAFAVLFLIIFISARIGNIVVVLIIGIMIGYAINALVGVLQFFSRSMELQEYVIWGLGSFSKTTLTQSVYLSLSILILIVFSFFFRNSLNVLLMGKNYAQSMGINTKRMQFSVLLIAGLLIALATAFTGPIAFLGLAIPHIARNLFNTSNHRVLLPAVIILGAFIALVCNFISKLPGYDTSLPINAVTSMIGAPIVIWAIIKRSKIRQS